MGREDGSALPATLIVLLLLLVAGVEALLAAASVRWGVARGMAVEQAHRDVESGLALATGLLPEELAAALAGNGDLCLPVVDPPVVPPGRVSVRIRDDEDLDGDPRGDSNGRARLQLVARVDVGPASWAARRSLEVEVLVGAWLPQPAALVDCSDGPEMCGGDQGCAVPPARVDGGGVAALAVRPERLGGAEDRLWRLAREVLRRSDAQCRTTACAQGDDALTRAAATAVARLVEGVDADATDWPSGDVHTSLQVLLDLSGEESGVGFFTWRDGSLRTVADMSHLIPIVRNLTRPSGHQPPLTDHPLAAMLSGAGETAVERGLCRVLEPLLASATSRGGDRVTVIDRGRSIAGGDVLEGAGLMIVRSAVELSEGGVLRWTGVVVLAGGSIQGDGLVEVSGGVVNADGRSPAAPGVDLGGPSWSVRADPDAWRDAWSASGTVPMARWSPPEGR